MVEGSSGAAAVCGMAVKGTADATDRLGQHLLRQSPTERGTKVPLRSLEGAPGEVGGELLEDRGPEGHGTSTVLHGWGQGGWAPLQRQPGTPLLPL